MKKMKNIVKWAGIIALVVVIGFSLIACKKDSLDGTTWKATDRGEELILKFNSPNFALSVDGETVLEGSYGISGLSVSMATVYMSFTGTLSGNILTLTEEEDGDTLRFTKQ